MNNIIDFCKKHKIQVIGGAVATVLIIGIIVVAAVMSNKENVEVETEETTTVVETTTQEETTTAETESLPASKLTGEPVSEKIAKRRPVAVMINNISDSLPQYGIEKAGVIYECPVEGGITRLMALFDDYSKLNRIGSIRSCRIYYCYFALEWDAIYCHFGQSKYAVDFLHSGNIDNVSAYNAPSFYFQTSDRYAPHNTFINTKGVDGAIKALKYRRKYKDGYEGHFQFAEKENPIILSEGTAAKTIEIDYPHNHPVFQYDKSSGTYLRSQLGQKHIDKNTGHQLAFKNVLIQFVDTAIYPDGKSIDMTVTGKGEGYYITNGNAVKIKWSKSKKASGQTKYVNAETGEDIVLNQGKTFVCVVGNKTAVNISE
ncbi:MAG: DUF3048 domain-containing protein [Lachnospiraceae bacterium]|nr:DUF3048 domain-containing protein [Lachnospiraceae bacterium]